MPCPETAYCFYRDTYGGTSIEEERWAAMSARAGAYIAKLEATSTVTPYAPADDDDAVSLAWSMALCAVADRMAAHEAATAAGAGGRGPVSAVTVGSVSTSYDPTFGGSLDLTPAGREADLFDAATRYLHVYLGVELW